MEGLRESCTAHASVAVTIVAHSGNGIGAHMDRVDGENGGCGVEADGGRDIVTIGDSSSGTGKDARGG